MPGPMGGPMRRGQGTTEKPKYFKKEIWNRIRIDQKEFAILGEFLTLCGVEHTYFFSVHVLSPFLKDY